MRELAAAFGLLFLQPAERPPLEYQGSDPITIQVTFAHPTWVDTRCRKLVGREPAPGKVFVACAGIGRKWAVLPHGCLFADAYSGLVCHELGHINGWDHG